jgi:site-specific DNA recombinase
MRERTKPSSSRSGGEEGKRVGLWIRVSTEDQARGESPEHHETRGRMYAESKGWTVVTVYHLEGVSGKSVMGHPEAKRMLQDVYEGAISGLIFSKLARLARNTPELLEFAAIFEEHGADLISLAESIDTSTPAGRLFYTLIAAMAQWEREEIAERVAASVPVRAKLGKRISGAAPYGYAWTDGKLVPDEKEAPVRKLMYELFRETRRVRTVAGLLNKRGCRTRNGSPFTNTTVRRLILDPTAKGLRRANYTRSQGDGKKWKLKPESDWVEVPIPAIVDVALWEECASVLRERSAGPKPGPRPVHLFTGAVFCHCGRKMYVPSNSPKWTCYGCRNKIPVPDLERVFAEQLKGFAFSEEAMADHLAEVDTVIEGKRELLQTLRSEEGVSRTESEMLYRLYLEGGLSVQGFRERNDPLEKRKGELQTEIPRLQGEIDFLAIRKLGSAEVLAEAKTLYERWATLAFELKREIVETIVEKIVVGLGEVEIDLASLSLPSPSHPAPLLPSSPELPAERERIHTDSSRQGAKTGPGRAGGHGRERR